jgi:hypothetical protein
MKIHLSQKDTISREVDIKQQLNDVQESLVVIDNRLTLLDTIMNTLRNIPFISRYL